MEDKQNVTDRIAAATASAKQSIDHISEIQKLMDAQNPTDDQIEDLRTATIALELIAVDTFSAFESAMQHHFKRGPFARKLKTLLENENQGDLAHRFHQYYLAINVLKHGTGASFRELRDNPHAMFDLRAPDDAMVNHPQDPVGLVDVSVSGFFDGLTKTILEAHDFLENR